MIRTYSHKDSSISAKFDGAARRGYWESSPESYFMLLSLLSVILVAILWTCDFREHSCMEISCPVILSMISCPILVNLSTLTFLSAVFPFMMFLNAWFIYDVPQCLIISKWRAIFKRLIELDSVAVTLLTLLLWSKLILAFIQVCASHCCNRLPQDFLPPSRIPWENWAWKQPYGPCYIGQISSSCQPFYNLEWPHQNLLNCQITWQAHPIL